MKCIFLADTHFGGRDLEGFQMQPRYVEHGAELIDAVERLVRREKADLVIHGGDLTDNGSPEQIRMVSRLFRERLSVPVAAALGNHDCMEPDCETQWLSGAPELFPEHGLDTTWVRDGVRIDILGLLWGENGRRWIPERGQFIRLSEAQWERLRRGPVSIPRVIVMHSQVRPVPVERTGLPNPLLVPENRFSEVGDALAAEFSPKLILGGHSHCHQLDRLGDTVAAAVASCSETPFECKVLEFSPERFSMRTVALAPELGFEPQYCEERRYVQGDASIRELVW